VNQFNVDVVSIFGARLSYANSKFCYRLAVPYDLRRAARFFENLHCLFW